jgi:predicted enzyme related to lactoylglutathione lyase
MSRPIHFEIHAAEPGRAIAFYTALFGWQFSKWDGPMPYWLITTGPDSERGINGGLVLRKGDAPAAMAAVTAFVCTVDTADLDASLAKVAALGGIVVVPKMPIPGVGWLAYAKDTEGNLFGLMQPDPATRGTDSSTA